MSKAQDAIKVIKEKHEEIVTKANPSVREGLSAVVAAAQEQAAGLNKSTGIGLTPTVEPIPNYLNSETCEKIIDAPNLNCQIVLGRDRPSDRLSGYGGMGVKRSFSIDLVAGRMGPVPKEVNSSNDKIWADNNYVMDAARILISQRTNVDHNFKINSTLAPPSKNCSAVAIKADSVRLVARKDIKIVTGTDHYDSKGKVPGVDYPVPIKICLIGSNRDDLLQPMVKGDNLVSCIMEIGDILHHILSTIDIIVLHQNNINEVVMNHTHISPYYGKSTSASPEIARAYIPFTKLVSDAKSSILELTGMIESNRAAFIYLPSDNDANTTNLLSNYNFCN